MSSQSYIYNPTERTLAAAGDGFSCPRLTTAGRTSLALTANDKGMMVYDTTLNNLFIWTGAAWESVPASGDAGANGAVQYNDNGVVAGATNFFWDKVNNRVGIGTSTPAYNLQVIGTSGSLVEFVGSAVAGMQKMLQIRTASGNSGGFSIQSDFTTEDVLLNLFYNSSMIFGVNNTPIMTLKSTGLGIGGTPSAKLHVIGGNLRINDSYQLEFGGSTNSIAGSNANNTMNIYTNNVLRVSIKANGQVRFIPLAADPAGAEAGDVYYNSVSNKLKCYNGTIWNDLF